VAAAGAVAARSISPRTTGAATRSHTRSRRISLRTTRPRAMEPPIARRIIHRPGTMPRTGLPIRRSTRRIDRGMRSTLRRTGPAIPPSCRPIARAIPRALPLTGPVTRPNCLLTARCIRSTRSPAGRPSVLRLSARLSPRAPCGSETLST
jgi:hypothetical protein